MTVLTDLQTLASFMQAKITESQSDVAKYQTSLATVQAAITALTPVAPPPPPVSPPPVSPPPVSPPPVSPPPVSPPPVSWTPPVISPALPDSQASFSYLGLQWWAQSGNAQGITFPAPYVIRCYNTPADHWYFDANRVPPDNRSEIACKTHIPNGTRVGMQVDILWEASANNDAAYLTFLQARDTVEVNSSPFAFMMQYQSDRPRINLYYNGGYKDIYSDANPMVRSTWYHYDIDLLINAWGQSNGLCKVTRNGTVLANLSNISIGWSGMGTAWYFKHGVYRGAASGSLATNQGMQFRNLKIINPFSGTF